MCLPAGFLTVKGANYKINKEVDFCIEDSCSDIVDDCTYNKEKINNNVLQSNKNIDLISQKMSNQDGISGIAKPLNGNSIITSFKSIQENEETEIKPYSNDFLSDILVQPQSKQSNYEQIPDSPEEHSIEISISHTEYDETDNKNDNYQSHANKNLNDNFVEMNEVDINRSCMNSLSTVENNEISN